MFLGPETHFWFVHVGFDALPDSRHQLTIVYIASHVDKGLMQSAESDTPVTEFCILLRTSLWIELSTLHQATLLDPAKLINFVLPWSNTESLSLSQ